MGYYHLQIISGPPNEAFFYKTVPSDTSIYLALWNHNAKQETQLICQPDCQLFVKPGMETKAAKIWATASRSHLILDFRFNSQPLAAVFTNRKCIGGSAWPNVNFTNEKWDYALPYGATALWACSSFGGTATANNPADLE